MWYGRTSPSSTFFPKPWLVQRRCTNKLEPQAHTRDFYVEPSPNRPRNSMWGVFSSGSMIESRNVTWASIPPPRISFDTNVWTGMEPAEPSRSLWKWRSTRVMASPTESSLTARGGMKMKKKTMTRGTYFPWSLGPRQFERLLRYGGSYNSCHSVQQMMRCRVLAGPQRSILDLSRSEVPKGSAILALVKGIGRQRRPRTYHTSVERRCCHTVACAGQEAAWVDGGRFK